ncbi:hypothetical protein ELQ92_01695 [Labedella populi]|uniref:Uncharacterized protein n=1 Tax=Labedella populi TaxID=2498850 RepID=A0A3S4AG45_9MICO|nr:hypothetical protein [Labedella populi]RWZ67997.1 hypothetical protein ELQ92_01695 [Labedella populi]
MDRLERDRSAEEAPEELAGGNGEGDRSDGTLVPLLTFLVPIVAWLVSLAGSYAVQDFTCSAASSVGHPQPVAGLTVVLIALNAAMLAVCVISAAVGAVLLRRGRASSGFRLRVFLLVVGFASSLFFAFGVVLIGANPLIYGACQ